MADVKNIIIPIVNLTLLKNLKLPQPLMKPQFSPLLCLLAIICGVISAVGQSSVSLGAAGSFAVLGGSAVTDAGGSSFYGNVGVSPGTSITGIGGSSVSGGAIHNNDTLAMQAHTSAEAAYGTITGFSPGSDLSGSDLGGMILAPGFYTFATSAQLTGNLTLDGLGFTNPEWIFQIGSTLTTASASKVLAINGANSSNVFFQVGSSASLGTGTEFVGNILADQSITSTSGVTVEGRLLAINAAVTLDGTVVSIPEVSSSALVVFSVMVAALYRRRGRPSSPCLATKATISA